MAAVDEIVRLIVEYSVPGASQVLNVFYWIVNTAVSDAQTHQDMVDWVTTVWGPDWADIGVNNASITQVQTEIVEWDGTKIVVVRNLGDSTVSIPGLLASDNMPGGVAASIFASTPRPKTRGRKFIPAIGDADVVGGFFTGSLLGDLAVMLVDYFLEWQDGSGGGAYDPGVVSTVTGLFLRFLLTGGFDDVPDYMRPRRPDRGS